MRWTPGYRSDDVIDRRGERASAGGGGLLQLAFLLLRFKYGWVVLLLLAGVYYVGGFGGASTDDAPRAATGVGQRAGAAQGTEAQFVSFVLDDVQSSWEKALASG